MPDNQEAIQLKHESAKLHLEQAIRLIRDHPTYTIGQLSTDIQNEITAAVEHLDQANELV